MRPEERRFVEEMVGRIVAGFDPLKVILFGSLARGERTKHSDADLLVVFREVEREDARRLTVEIRRALADVPFPKDVVVADLEEIGRRGGVVGTVPYAALREGEVLYERPSPPPPNAPSLPAGLGPVLERLSRGLEDLYGGRYRGLVLYGSYARGQAHDESDVDLLLLLEGQVDRFREALRAEPVKWPLSSESGYVLSVVPVGWEEFRNSREPLLWNAREEGVVLHRRTDAGPSPDRGEGEHA